MNELVNLENGKMMSSKRIAERTGKEHSNVLRDIRNMIQELSESQDSNLNPTEYQEIKAKNLMTAEILLNERLSLCLASGYSISLRMMIIDDWAVMKGKLNKPKEFTIKELLLLQLETIERAEKAEQKVENLTITLDSSLEWSSIIKCATWNKIHESVFKWQILKKKSTELGYGIKKLPSTRYSYQNAYHVNVFRACYPQYNYNFKDNLIEN